MNETETKPKRPYFRPTTPAQRRLLFETYEATHDVAEACAKAHVGQGTYYYWRPRFETEGYEGLDHERSRAPHRTRIAPIGPEIVEEVVAYKRAHPAAGYRTVAQRVREQRPELAETFQNVVDAYLQARYGKSNNNLNALREAVAQLR